MPAPSNTRFALAVHLLGLLAGSPERVQSSELLATSVVSNPVHVRRVLGLLRRAGLVTSRPGAGGGWLPTYDPVAATLADVWRAVDGGEPLLGLHAVHPACPVGRAVHVELTGLDRAAAAALERELAAVTVADLLTRATADAT